MSIALRSSRTPSPRAAGVALAALSLALCATAWGYVEAVYPLGRLMQESTNIVHMRVEKVDKEKNLIVYRKIRDLKGNHPGETIKHNIGQGGFHPREWQNIMAWAEVGQSAVFFHNGGAGETCIKNYWYQTYAGDWWAMSHAEPFLLRSFAGNPDKLAGAVSAMLGGQEVVVPAMVDGDRNAIQLRTARIQRIKASLKLQDYNVKRDFVGWGGDDFRAVLDMPAFAQCASLTRVDPGPTGIAPADFDNDGKLDFCLFGSARVALIQNAGGVLGEVALPIDSGARAAAWADCNGDGRPDLLLATPTGPRLLINGANGFTDATPLLPKQAYYNTTSLAFADLDGDGRQDILLADGFAGLRLWRNVAGPTTQPTQPARFADISDAVGLGEKGLGGDLKGDHLAVADVDGDGRPDVLYSAGRGLLVLNTGKSFVAGPGNGIQYITGGVAPAFGDFDGDGDMDLFVPQDGACKLYRNDGRGRFSDVAAAAGLGAPMRGANCGFWCRVRPDAPPDLLVGCLRGPNRYFRNNGDGTFTDATEAMGFHQRIHNTRAILAADLNRDGAMDVVLSNEGQEPMVYLGGARSPTSKPTK